MYKNYWKLNLSKTQIWKKHSWKSFALQMWHKSVASNSQKLKIFDLGLFLLTPPPSLPASSNSMQQAILELLHFLLFRLLPVILPPSLRSPSLHSLSWKKSSSWFFSLKRAEENWILAALPFAGLWLQAEGGGRTGQEKGKEAEGVEGQDREEKKAGEKCCVGHFLKACTDRSSR